jgi:hypothetical protein
MRYSKYSEDTYQYQRPIHPVWRGIGCILFIILPVIAYAIAHEMLSAGLVQQYVDIPSGMMQPYTVRGMGLTMRNFQATLAVAAAVTVLLYSGMFVVYAFLYRMVGPPRYGPMDVAPPKRRGKVKKSR